MASLSEQQIYFAYPGKLDTPSGGYRYDRELIEHLRARGHKLSTVELPDCLPELSDAASSEISATLAGIEDGATVIVDGLAFGLMDELAKAETTRLRLIALCHHPLALETGLDETTQQRLQESEQRALSHCRAIIVTSDHTKQILIQQFAVAPAKITVALPGTEPSAFSPGDGEPPRLLTVASLTARKGHDVLIRALSQLKHLPWQARFVGSESFDPEWAAQCRQQAEALGLGSRIDFAGSVENSRPEYLSAELFVLPSHYEGYGMVFAEALAAGLPVIACKAGAVPSVVPEDAGILVPANDSEQLAQALARVLGDRELRRSLARGARAAASRLPTWRDTAATVTKLIQQVGEQ